MWPICKKEFSQFFSTLTGLISIFVFSVLNGLMLFVFSSFNIFDAEYATLDNFFYLAPLILLSLVPAITMRSFSDEFKAGTYEILQTRPLSIWQIVTGKYLGSLMVVGIALLPTIVYAISIQALSPEGVRIYDESTTGAYFGRRWIKSLLSLLRGGPTTGAYFGLFLLAAVFTAVGNWCSSSTNNSVVAFIVSALACLLLYIGFSAISKIPLFAAGADYYIEMLGIDFHYQSISRGVIDSRDIVYFFSLITLFLFFSYRNLMRR